MKREMSSTLALVAPVGADARARVGAAVDRARLERMFVAHHALVWRTLRRRGLSRLIHRHLELLEVSLVAGAGKRLPRGLPTSTKPAQ